MRYTLYTENVNRPAIDDIVSKEFPGVTFLESSGLWKGSKELSLMLIILGNGLHEKVFKVAKEIKTVNNQQAVIVEVIDNTIFEV